MIEIISWSFSFLLMVLTIIIHYEVILLVSDKIIPWGLARFHNRRVMMLAILALMLGHIAEIWIFALSMMLVSVIPDFGSLAGHMESFAESFIYFSAVTYTSLGYGDIRPTGGIRSMAVTETLTGLTMIAWSASFTYLKMEQLWQARRRRATDPPLPPGVHDRHGILPHEHGHHPSHGHNTHSKP